MYKGGTKDDCGNCSPVSVTSIVLNTLEIALRYRTANDLETNKLMMLQPHAFFHNLSCMTNLTSFPDEVPGRTDRKGRVEVCCMNFQRFFASVTHRLCDQKVDADVKNRAEQSLTGRPFGVRNEGRQSDRGLLYSAARVCLRNTAFPDFCQQRNQWFGKFVSRAC